MMSCYQNIFVTYRTKDTDVESHILYRKIGKEYGISEGEIECIKWFQIPDFGTPPEKDFPKISEIFRDPLYEEAWKCWKDVLGHFEQKRFFMQEIWIEKGDTQQNFWEIFYQDLLNHWEIELRAEEKTIPPRFFYLYGFSKRILETNQKIPASIEVVRENVNCFETILKKIETPKRGRVTGVQIKEIPILGISITCVLGILEKNNIVLREEEAQVVQGHYADFGVQQDRKKFDLPTQPNDIELQMIAQSWSEHCKHKIFGAKIRVETKEGKLYTINSLYKSYIQKVSFELLKSGRTELLSLFSDNAGVVQFTAKSALCMKVETHNAPTAIAPYKGALTGICGVQRDIIGTGLGGQPIFHMGALFFGPLTWKKSGRDPSPILSPQKVFDECMQGIGDAGDRTGVPTLGMSLFFGKEFAYRPVVFCGAGGVIPIKSKETALEMIQKQARAGDRIVIVGAKTTISGTDGATMSSSSLEKGREEKSKSIPGGDPITARCMMEFLLAARDRGLYTSITDNGAGGLSCSIGEMGKESNGAIVYLEKLYLDRNEIPCCTLGESKDLKEIFPWKIFLSESQDRMTVSVPVENVSRFSDLAKEYSVGIYDIGEFTNSGYITTYWMDQCIGRVNLEFLHNGCPQLELRAKLSVNKKSSTLVKRNLDLKNFEKTFSQILSSPNIASKYNWVREFDNFILGQTVIRPFDGVSGRGRSNACVIRPNPKEEDSVAVSFGVHPTLGMVDGRANSFYAVDTAVRAAMSVGANPRKLYGLDNFSWPDPIEGKNNPDGEEKLGKLVESCESLYEICKAYKIPLISGKDSMKNDFIGEDFKISIPPLVLVSLMGFIPSYRDTTTGFAKRSNSLLYILGETKEHLCGSQLYETLDLEGGSVPMLQDLSLEVEKYRLVYEGHQCRLFDSCRSIDRGGLVTAIAELLMGGEKGARIKIPEDEDPYVYCYSETLGRFLVEIDPKNKEDFEKLFFDQHVEYLGEITNGDLEIFWKEKPLLRQSWLEMRTNWENFSHSGPRSQWNVV